MALLSKLRKPKRAYEQLKAEKEVVEAKLNDQRSEIQALSTKVNQLSSARAADWDRQRREIEALSAKFNQVVAAYGKLENNQRGVNTSLPAPCQTGDQRQFAVAESESSTTNTFQTQRTNGHLFATVRPSVARKPVAPQQVGARFTAQEYTGMRRTDTMQDCNVCVETKPSSAFPIFSISKDCEHSPQTCCNCIEISIKTEFESKIWNQIHCPECHSLMDYEDVERQADRETFAKYQALSVKETAGTMPDFVWCPADCGSGQLQANASTNPIVQCVACRFRFCFRHRVEWHEGLCCDEYDEREANPEGFRSYLEIANEEAENENRLAQVLRQEQEDADRRFAQSLVDDEERQRAEQQAAEERRQRERREAAEEARRQAEREAARQKAEQQRREAAVRKQQEMAGEKFVKSMTKPCPSCKWHIEKNAGCDHMTCIKCRYEFCWLCLSPWANHGASCRG